MQDLAIRKIAKILSISRNTVRKYVLGENLPQKRGFTEREKPVTGTINDKREEYLRQDESEWSKHHTAWRIFQRERY
ncbi:MAG: hypothetical protein RDV48_31320 [Candidatus Eremiobacteraeota bacterium]|nr:hypothetical protein [Candidatus Eremiobacteraeota bacterium]